MPWSNEIESDKKAKPKKFRSKILIMYFLKEIGVINNDFSLDKNFVFY